MEFSREVGAGWWSVGLQDAGAGNGYSKGSGVVGAPGRGSKFGGWVKNLLQKWACSRSSGKSHSVGCQGASVGGQIQITEPEDQTAQPGFWKKKESVNLKTCQS